MVVVLYFAHSHRFPPPQLSVQNSLGVSGFHPPTPEGSTNLHFPDITPRQLYFAQSLPLPEKCSGNRDEMRHKRKGECVQYLALLSWQCSHTNLSTVLVTKAEAKKFFFSCPLHPWFSPMHSSSPWCHCPLIRSSSTSGDKSAFSTLLRKFTKGRHKKTFSQWSSFKTFTN